MYLFPSQKGQADYSWSALRSSFRFLSVGLWYVQGRSEEGARDSVLVMHSFAFVITDSHCTRPTSMYEGRVFTGDVRSENIGEEMSHIQVFEEREELEWIRRDNIKRIGRSKVSGDPFVGSTIGCLRISRQPTNDSGQFEGSPHQASRGFHRQLPT